MIPWWVNLAGVSYPGKLWKNSLNMTPRGIIPLWVNLPGVSYLSKSFYFNLKFENLHKTLIKIIKILTHWLVAQADSNEKNEGRKSHWCTDVWGRSSIAFPAGVNTIYGITRTFSDAFQNDVCCHGKFGTVSRQVLYSEDTILSVGSQQFKTSLRSNV